MTSFELKLNPPMHL